MIIPSIFAGVVQASGPQTPVPASGAWIRWMVRGTKLPLWALQQQRPTQHPRLQQLWDARQVVSHLSASYTYKQIESYKLLKKNPHDSEEFVWLLHLMIWVSPLLFFSLYQLCLCIPFSAHLFSPKQPYVHSGSLELAAWHVSRLAVGLISAAYLSPGQINTHWQTHSSTRPPETAGCVGCMLRHLEEAKHRKEGCQSLLPSSVRHASAAPHNSSLCSSQLRFPEIHPSTKTHWAENFLPY